MNAVPVFQWKDFMWAAPGTEGTPEAVLCTEAAGVALDRDALRCLIDNLMIL